ncbi:MAG: hypothetical protein ACE361_00635 [Aureliella sp.]
MLQYVPAICGCFEAALKNDEAIQPRYASWDSWSESFNFCDGMWGDGPWLSSVPSRFSLIGGTPMSGERRAACNRFGDNFAWYLLETGSALSTDCDTL